MRICEPRAGDLDDVLDLGLRAFGSVGPEHAQRHRRDAAERIAGHRYLGVRDGDRLVAAAAIIDMVQWWHGRAVPLGGITGVVVAPEDRGRGAGTHLMRAVLERCAERGHPLSMLYPATRGVYRRAGYEVAGRVNGYTFPMHALRGLAPAGGERTPLRRVGEVDAEEVAAVLGRVHRASRRCGPTAFGPAEIPWWLRADDVFCYLAADGLLAYAWQDGNRAIDVKYLAGASETTLRTLWAAVASHGTIADRVHARLSPDDPLFWLLRDPAGEPHDAYQWMLRVLDPAAALTARGYPPGVRTEVTLTVDDPLLAAGSGTWHLTVADGTALAEPTTATAGAVRLGPGTLAALYAGTPTSTLRLSGLLHGGDPATDAALDAAFTCRAATLEWF